MNEIKKVLVTGAGGTVGGYIVGELLKKGFYVVAHDLSNDLMSWRMEYWRECKREGGGNFCIIGGDLREQLFINYLFESESIDSIIHSAALVDVSLPRELLMSVNLEATKLLYKKFVEKKGRVFVFLSSGSAYGEAPILKETTPFSPSSAYEESKALAEEFLSYSCARDRSRVLVLRPSLIYGPRNKFLAANYLAISIVLNEIFGKDMPWIFLGPKTNLVHAEDVARAAVFLLEKHSIWAPGYAEAFNVCDDSPMGFGDHLREIARACGYKTKSIIFLPLPPARLIRIFKSIYSSSVCLGVLNATLMYFWKNIEERNNLVCGFKPNLSKAMTPFFGQNTIFSNQKIKAVGFEFKHPYFRKGIEEVVGWYKKEKWIP